MLAIQTNNLNIGYGETTLLADVNLNIKAGEFVLIVGGNGSGKTTLLKTLLGLVPARNGGVSLFGKSLSRRTVSEHVSYVPQTIKLERDFPISVEEVINLECRNVHHKHESSSEHLKAFNAAHLLKRKLNELSGGEFQKVMIARALVSNLDIIMLDEPTNNLDEASSKQLLLLLADLHKAGKTIVVITHDINDFTGVPVSKRTLHLSERKVVAV